MSFLLSMQMSLCEVWYTSQRCLGRSVGIFQGKPPLTYQLVTAPELLIDVNN